MHNYAALSDHDFELLAASLLEAEFGGRWEAFARGPDGGVDVRQRKGATAHIVQCKHTPSSTMSTLNSAARKEKKNLDKMKPKPASYRFWTTKSLTPANKATLMTYLGPWIKNVEDIWGREDIELALLKHPDVERAHVKLWIAGAGQLSQQVNGGIWERSRQLAVDIDAALPRYVETGILEGALSQLEKNRVLIVSGPPGVGKTTVARLLVARAVLDGYEPIEISSDVSEGQQVIEATKKQIFYYDDFLGSTFLTRLDKNEDKRLASFIRSAELNPTTKFVMTTREYILRQALEDYEELERAGVPIKKLVVHLKNYTRVERGRILYNHLYHSDYVGDPELAQLKKDKSYLKIIDHPNYNPRLIEFITMTDRDLRDGPPEDFVRYAMETLDSPETVWRRPFDSLDDIGQSLVMLLACVPAQLAEADVDALLATAASAGLCKSLPPGGLEKVLKVLDDSFLATDRGGPTGTALLIKVHNPSISDFIAALLATERSRRSAMLAAVPYFEQSIWLFENLLDQIPPDDLDAFIVLITDALVRTFENPAPRLKRHEPAFWEERAPKWVHSDPVERLVAVNSVMAASKKCEEILEPEFQSWLAEQVQLWKTEPGSFATETCADVVRLVKELSRRTGLAEEVWQGAVDLVSNLEASSWKWSMLNSLGMVRDIDTDFLLPWREEFEQWFDGLLDVSLEDLELQELDEARGIAEELGASFDVSRFDPLHEELSLRQSELEEREYDEWKDTRGYNDGDDELGAIFGR